MSYTLFTTPEIEIYSDNVTDPMSSSFVQGIFNELLQYEVDSYKVATLVMDSGDTSTIVLTGTVLANRKFILLKVVGSDREIGECHILTTAKDFDGTTNIVGRIHTIGTELFPGYILLTTYNVSQIDVVADSDDIEVQIFASKIQA